MVLQVLRLPGVWDEEMPHLWQERPHARAERGEVEEEASRQRTVRVADTLVYTLCNHVAVCLSEQVKLASAGCVYPSDFLSPIVIRRKPPKKRCNLLQL